MAQETTASGRVRWVRALLLFAALTAAVGVAHATLLGVNWKASQDDLLTRDTESGLDWLDITLTFGRTVNEVLAQTGAGGLYEGFRWATRGEFETLYAHAGLTTAWSPYAPGASDPAKMNLAYALQDLLGYHAYADSGGGSGRYSAGYVRPAPGSSWNFGLVGYYDQPAGGPWPDYYRAEVYGVFPASTSTGGVWLVRDSSTSPFVPDIVIPDPQAALPVPATAWLVAAVLTGLGLGHLRRPRGGAKDA